MAGDSLRFSWICMRVYQRIHPHSTQMSSTEDHPEMMRGRRAFSNLYFCFFGIFIPPGDLCQGIRCPGTENHTAERGEPHGPPPFLRPRVGREVSAIEEIALEAMESYEWPGNVRELNNVIERAMLLCSKATAHPVKGPHTGGEPPDLTHRAGKAVSRVGHISVPLGSGLLVGFYLADRGARWLPTTLEIVLGVLLLGFVAIVVGRVAQGGTWSWKIN